jgi:PBSX family phage terminase large subunit
VARLSEKQKTSIREATARVNIWEGSVSSGKTLASLIVWCDYVANKAPPHGRLPMVGRTKDTLYRNVLEPLRELLPAGSQEFQHTKGSDTARLFGQELDILGANDTSAESRIRGMTARGFYVDEWSLLPGDGYWSQLLNRLRVPGAKGFVTTNPEGPNHWAKVQVLDRLDELDYKAWHFELDDNPVLTEEYKAAIRRENVGLWYQRNVLGLWVLSEGTIWDCWREERHVVTELPELSALELAVDDGTAGVFAAVLLALGTDSCLYAAREFRWDAKAKQTQLTDRQKVDKLRVWLESVEAGTDGNPPLAGASNPRLLHVDPAATSLIRQFDVDRWPVVKAKNEVRDGLQYVATLLTLDRLKVHRSCSGLTDEIPNYVWDTKAAKQGEDRPLKVNDHSCDALRYAVMGTASWWFPWTEHKRTLEN